MKHRYCSISRVPIFGFFCLWLISANGPAWGFHEGGAASCSGCHVMHGSDDGMIAVRGTDPLLRAPTASDVCLMCHGGQDGVFGNNPMDPPDERGAGNFVFLLEDNLNDGADGATSPIGGEAAGHSIISLDFGMGPDAQWNYSPGGTFPSDQLGCTSCHDPHGNRNFRMLNGTGPIQNALFDFINPAPVAEGLEIKNPLAVEGPDLHTAYTRGMSDWCANCHGLYHDETGRDNFEHSSGEPLAAEHLRSYNRYEGDSNPEGNFFYTSYLPAVPFESGKSTVPSTEGPQSGARVMCLSCHRAHASSAPHAGRWDFNVDRLENDGLISGSWTIPNPYPSDHAQGQLCAKCHSQAEPD